MEIRKTMTTSALRIVLASVFVMMSTATTVWAEGDEAQELKALIESLQERITALENELLHMKGDDAVAQQAVDERVSELASQIAESPSPEPNDFRVYWKEGLRFDTEDGRFKLKIGGRIQNDWVWYDQPDELEWIWNPITQTGGFVDTEDGTEFRRARLYIEGDIYSDIKFKMQYDFAGGDADFKDVYMQLKNVPYVGNIKVGHFKEPFSMDELTSSKHITFMERALPNAFAPGRNTGIQLNDSLLDERMTWAIGIFKDVNNFGDGQDDGQSGLTARVTGLPYYADDGRRLIHLGAAYSVRNIDGNTRFRTRPEAHMAPQFIDTGNLYNGTHNLLGLEAAAVWGPFSIQGEYMLANDIENILVGRRDFDGYYLEAGYFLTGENRSYKKSSGTWDKIKPKRNFSLRKGEQPGWGAWELAARYSTIDLDSELEFPGGGNEDNLTLGLNWYLNPNTRLMFNYINADIDHPLYSGDLDIFQTRFQLAF
jgi:phosphate-selective porin OprO/OprP